MNLNEVITAVRPLDEAAMAAARERQAQLAKPPGSLGRLEELSVQLAGITGKVYNIIEKGRYRIGRLSERCPAYGGAIC